MILPISNNFPRLKLINWVVLHFAFRKREDVLLQQSEARLSQN